MINERVNDGRERAKIRGVKFGVKPKKSEQNIEDMINAFSTPCVCKSELARSHGISRFTLFRLVSQKSL